MSEFTKKDETEFLEWLLGKKADGFEELWATALADATKLHEAISLLPVNMRLSIRLLKPTKDESVDLALDFEKGTLRYSDKLLAHPVKTIAGAFAHEYGHASHGMTQVRFNALRDPNYAPFCLCCSSMERMAKQAPFYWKCRHCGAEHDERRNNDET